MAHINLSRVFQTNFAILILLQLSVSVARLTSFTHYEAVAKGSIFGLCLNCWAVG